MNELIKKLAEQCGINNYYSLENRFENFDEVKFVELVVRECGEVALKHIYNDNSFSFIPSALNKHFGVEK